jgi:N-acetylneuraminic acid mutarotase
VRFFNLSCVCERQLSVVQGVKVRQQLANFNVRMRVMMVLAHALTVQCFSFKPDPRYGHCSFAVDGTVWVVGGTAIRHNNESALSSEVLAFNMSSYTWGAASAAPLPIEGHSCTAVGSSVYIVGGWGGEEGTAAVWNRVWRMDIATMQWHGLSPLPVPGLRRHQTIYLADKETLLVMGGSAGPSCQENLTNAVFVYSIARDIWQLAHPQHQQLPAPRMGHTLTRASDTSAWLVGGQTSNYCSPKGFRNDVWRLGVQWEQTEARVLWTEVTAAGAPPVARYGHTAWLWWEDGGATAMQIAGGTCGNACGASGHTNDTFILRTTDEGKGTGKDSKDSKDAGSGSGSGGSVSNSGVAAGVSRASANWERVMPRGAGPFPRDRHTSVAITEGGMTVGVADYGGFIKGPRTISADMYYLGAGDWRDLELA